MTAEQLTVIQILNKTVRLDGESIGDFAKELKKLTDEEKHELAVEGAKYLGVELVEKGQAAA